ncbi:Uncharacterized protein FKW44_008070, partial [Caligus rogercresseyi]
KLIEILDVCKDYYDDWLASRSGTSLILEDLGLGTSYMPLRDGIRSARRMSFGSKGRSKKNKKNCEILIYPKTNFRGQPQRFFESRRFISPKDKSIRTFGHCCWKLYA